MSNTVVLFYSGYGHTKRVAEHVAKGAQAQLIEISAEGDISEADWQALDAAKAIIFGSPTYMGNVAWQFKKVADASSGRWYTRAWKDKLAGGFSCSQSPSGDKLSTLQYMSVFAMQHGMVWVGQDKVNDGTNNRIGSFTGLMVQQPTPTASADELLESDLNTARAFGERILGLANRF